TVANQTPSATVSSAKSTVVSTQITAAQAAFKQNPDASDSLNGTDPLANYAYKTEMDALQAQYKNGIADAKAGTSPATTASDAEKQGASDYTAGLNAAVNGQTIANPTSGQKAGEAAIDSFNKGYQDAKNGTDDSTSTDPVQKAAQVAATAAFNDVKNNSVKTSDEIKAMNPVAQVAYQKALAEAQADAAKGAQAYVNGGSRPDDSTVDGKATAAGYDKAKAGYTDGQSGNNATSTDPSYTTGYNAGKSETSGYDDQKAPADDASQAEKDAYNAAKAGAADGIAGKQPADNSTQSQAYKDAYTKAYQDATNGYNTGYAAGQNGTKPDASQAADPSYMKGYNAGQAAKQAIADDQDGQNKASSSADSVTYNDAQQGYHDGVIATGKTGVNTPNATAVNGDAPYQVAYDQAIKDTNAARAVAYQDADNDHGQTNGSSYKYSANSDVQTVAQQAYTDAQTAYAEAISGATTPTSPNDAQASGITTAKNDQTYVDDTVANQSPSATVSSAKSTVVSAQITAAQKAFTANPDASDSLNSTDPLANYAYKTEMDALQKQYQSGITDAKAGTSPATTASDAEKQGASDYTAGLNAAVNGQTIDNPTSGNKAGEDAINSFNKGYQDAVDGKDDSSSADPVQKAAQAAATEAFSDVKNNTVKTSDEIKTMNPVAQVAYQKAEQEAQADAAKGAQAYVNGGSRPDDSTVDGKAAAAGYDAAKSGYTDGQSGKAATSTDPSYTTGYNAGKSEVSGYDDQKAPAADASQAEKDAYNAAKAGAADGIAGKQPADNSTQSQAYKDAYTKAYQDATNGYNAGYAAGQNGTKPSASQAADPSYMKGYNAGQAAKQAITDDQNGQNNASSSADSTTYSDAQQGYHDGVIATGKTFNNTPNATAANGDAPYQVAYDQAIKDTNAARAVAYQDADNDHGQANGSGYKYSANSDVQTVAQQAYTDAQTAYATAISGATTPTSPNDAQASGIATAKNDQSYVDATVANQAPSATVSTAKSTVVSTQIAAAQKAFTANPDASDSLNGADPLANYAYKAEMDSLQAKYKAGIQDAAAGTSPAATASDAEKQGASDYTNGLNAAVNGKTITNPTSGNKAGEAAADSFNKGYQDAVDGKDDSTSTDPVQKAAQAAASQAFKDVTNGTIKTPDEINTMNPVAKVAYQKAEQEAEADAAKGAQAYVNGGNRPDDSTVAGKAAAAGYDAAKAGYEDGQNGKATASTDPSYTTGYNAGKSEASGYSDQTAPAANAPQAEQDAYNGAKAGAADGTTSATKPSDLATKSQAYQDAYNKAYADAQAGAKAGYQDGSHSGTPTDLSGKDDIYKNAYNTGKATATDEAESGARDYVAGKSAPTADTPAGHYGYNQAKTAFADANAGKASQSTDSSYNIGYNASKSEQQAASGSEKGNTNQGQTASDPAAYTDAAKAYADAVTAAQAGNTATTTVTDPVYKQAYDQGLNDAEAARQAAIRDANANHGLNVDPAKVYSGNSAIQLFARKVYAEVQRTYADTLTGKTPSSPDSTQQQGVATANNDKAYVDATVAGTTPSATVSDTKATDVSDAITAAQKAFASNPDASDDLNGTDPLANYAYKVAMDDLQAKYKAGVAAAGNVNEPGSSADAATQRGANDFNTGLNAALSGQTITNPTSGEKAGEAEANAFNQGYADAQNGVDDSNAKDPVQKAAQKAATQAFSDSPDFKTDAEVNQMDPVSKAAYLKAEAEAKDEAANGAKNFVNGQTTPNNGTVAGKVDAAGYADAQKGYNDAKANVQPTAAEQADANYMKGYQAYKDSQTGYNNAGTQTKPADDAPQPEKDAYNGAIAGVADAVAGKAKESDLATKSQAYQDAYNKAYAAAQAGLNDADSEKSAQSTDPDYMTGYNAGKKHITTVDNTAQSDALSGLTPQDANWNAQDKAAYDEAYSRTIAGLNDGANGVSEAMPDDPNYQKGYAAGEAARALLADKQNNTHTTVADPASYDLAAQAYEQAEDDVANGRPKSPKNQSPVYVLVYDRAYDFLLNEKNQKKTPQPEPVAPVESAPTPAPVLPQTGEQQNVTENSGLVALLLSSILGLVATAKRKRNDK
ncbi:LPXTG cell wall anchor domain-containing protein, partial [Fructobacillus tropaeoli]|uniref:LPXTG cell wall anchor domain-containing protein n=1 Tax=Fructobacillus tropaeoli TaxID=709323 RepID=UPI0014560B39